MSRRPKIAITGAKGFIGSNLVKHFSKKGWQVLALTHSNFKLEDKLPNNYLKSVDYLIHCAYVPFKEGINSDQINESGTKELIRVSRANNVKIVYLSSISAHDRALSHYGKSKFELEKLFDQKKDLVLKIGLVIGKGGLFLNMARFALNYRLIPLIDQGSQPMQTISIDDLVKAIDRALEKNIHGTIILAHPVPVTYRDFFSEIGKVRSRRVFPISIPFSLLNALVSIISKTPFKSPISKEQLLSLKKMRSFDSKEDLNRLGIKIDSFDQSLRRYL
jgi:nucleoside-diphosphate-sugar epimerase